MYLTRKGGDYDIEKARSDRHLWSNAFVWASSPVISILREDLRCHTYLYNKINA